MKRRIVSVLQVILLGGMLFGCLNQQYEPAVECINGKVSRNFISEFQAAQPKELLDKYFDVLRLSLINCIEADSSLNLLMEQNLLDSDFKKARFLMLHWHATLNGEKVSLEERIQLITVETKRRENRIAQRRKISMDNLRRFETNDTVVARYPIEKLPNNYYAAIAYEEVVLWEFDDSNDFLVKGVLLAKTVDGLDSFLQIRVLSVNRSDVYLKMHYLKPGDTLLIESVKHPLTLE